MNGFRGYSQTWKGQTGGKSVNSMMLKSGLLGHSFGVKTYYVAELPIAGEITSQRLENIILGQGTRVLFRSGDEF